MDTPNINSNFEYSGSLSKVFLQYVISMALGTGQGSITYELNFVNKTNLIVTYHVHYLEE